MAQDDVKSIDQLNEEADIAADYLEGLLDIADYEGDIEMGVRNDRPTVQIVAIDSSGCTAEDRRAFSSDCGCRRFPEAQASAPP